MQTSWFVLLALMLAIYVVLDGFDLGVGALHRLLPRGEEERAASMAAIGPLWDGNEVWLIAGGGVLFLAFPKAYASTFSGLYLGMILVLWLLVGRAIGIELRERIDNPLWQSLWDTVFWLSSAALPLVLGTALGNVLRGVPLRADGYFHLSVFEILNWYSVLVGVLALVLVATHGAVFLAAFTTGDLAVRARAWARRLWWLALALLAGAGVASYGVREELVTTFGDHPARLVFPAVAVGALVAELVWLRAAAWRRAFAASCATLAALLATVAAALYPALVPARAGSRLDLTIHNAASGSHALKTGLFWWPVGILLAATWFALAYRLFVLRRPAGG